MCPSATNTLSSRNEIFADAKIELGPLYPQTYEGSFVAGVGNVMTSSTVDECILTGERLKHIPYHNIHLR